MNIVLIEPEIPQNSGNIIRTCAATGSVLHFIRPLGFHFTQKQLKRSAMDYMDDAKIVFHDDYEAFLEKEKPASIFFATTKAKHRYSDVSYNDNSYIVFGKESAGIPEEILVSHEDECIRIPMETETRSLNLANSVAIILYEALRQNDFLNLSSEGNLHRLSWEEK